MEVETDIQWQTQKRRTNTTNNNTSQEKAKRKCSTPTPMQEGDTTPPNTCINTTGEQARLYPETHKGPYIKIKIAPGKEKKLKVPNLIYMAKAMSFIEAGAHSIKMRGFSRAVVLFNNYQAANKTITSSKLAEMGILAFIPRFRLEKKGTLRDTAQILTWRTS